MGIFGNGETKEEKQEQKINERLKKYGLEDLSDPRDIQAVRNIQLALMGNKLIELGTALSGSGVDTAKLSYMDAIMQQNYIIIRQLDRIAKLLEK